MKFEGLGRGVETERRTIHVTSEWTTYAFSLGRGDHFNAITFEYLGDGTELEIASINVGIRAVGDSNLDGKFTSEDVFAVLAAARFETGEAATWEEGDFNYDGVFDAADIIEALAHGRYESGS